MEKIAFIINPASGVKNKNNIHKVIENKLDTSRLEPIIVYSEYSRHATELAAKFAADNIPYVVAVGGDGTVNEVAKALVHTNTALGIVPVGSGNGFAFHLGIPKSIKKAVDLLNNIKLIDVDYGLFNEKPFFCTCGAGFDAHISMKFAESKQRGFMNYVKKCVVNYFRYQSENYQLIGKGIDIKPNAFIITFANASQWGSNAYVAPNADITDGQMDICIISKFPLYAVPKFALQLFIKKLDNNLYINILRTNEITLIREKEGAFHFDGEPHIEDKIIKIRIVQAGLKVIIPKF
jgi:YegS/Rv2252/BmrU family lipid kinase